MLATRPSSPALIPWDVARDARLTVTARLVYGVLRSIAGPAGECHPSNAQVAEMIAKDGITARRCIADLADAGYLCISKVDWTEENPTWRVITFNVPERKCP